jgi:hypothetical protein
LNKDDDYKLWFQAEPGISLACPFKNSLNEIIEMQGSVGKTIDYLRFPNKIYNGFIGMLVCLQIYRSIDL